MSESCCCRAQTYTCRSCASLTNLLCLDSPDSPPQSCKPPTQLNGQDIEIAIRTPTIKPYPKRLGAKTQKERLTKAKDFGNRTRESEWNETDTVIKQSVAGQDWTPRYCLKRIHGLLVREETEEMGSRLNTLWAIYERQASDVFIYENVDVVANIVLHLSTSFIRLKFAHELLDKVMARLQRGIYMYSSKELRNIRRLSYLFTVLGLAIVEGHPYAQKSISSILGVWLENMVNKRRRGRRTTTTTTSPNYCSVTSSLMKASVHLTKMISSNILQQALEESLLPRTIAKYIRDGLHTEGYISILSLLKLCCDASPAIRRRLWCLSILDPVLLKLCMLDPSNRILIRTIDFAYSFLGLNSFSKNDKMEVVPALDREPFQILLTRFTNQLCSFTSKSLLNTRNDTAFLISLIGNKVPVSGEYFQGFGSIIGAMISSGIMGTKDVELPYMIDCTHEDLELLQYLIFMLKCIIEADCGEKIVNEYKIVSVLLILLLGPCYLTEEEMELSVMQGKDDLDNAAWSTIDAIAKHCPLSLLTPHGVPSLLSFLKAYGELGQGDEAILALTLQTLRVLLTTSDEGDAENGNVSEQVLAYFIAHDGMPIFLSVMRQLTKDNFDELQETVISNALLSIAALGFYDLNQKELFSRLEGVSILTSVMRHLLYHSAERRHMDPVVQIAIAECIWGCVAFYPSCLERFLAQEGLFRLLDILEISAGPAAPVHLINCIIQLCEYPRCMHQLLYWERPMKSDNQRSVFGRDVDADMRCINKANPKSGDCLQELAGKLDQSLASLLCQFWRDEESRCQVMRDPDGCIASLVHPLMSKFAREYESCGQTGVFRSCVDMSFSLRPKIFLLIKRIVEMTKTEATLFDDLSLPNQVVMQVIINYFDLKESEIYLEMMEEMQKQESVAEDETANTSSKKIVTVSKNKIATVLETQRYLIRRHREKEETKESEFYALMKRCRLQDHLIAAREVDFLARTTNYHYLVEKRLWQKAELERAAQDLDLAFIKNSRIHRTSDGHLNITAWTSGNRTIESEPPIPKEGFLAGEYEDNDVMMEEEEEYFDEEEEESEGGFGSIAPGATGGGAPHNVTAVPQDTEMGTPEPLEGGFYQVSPHLLRDALEKLLADRQRHDWENLMDQDQENYWKMRTKWKQDWYPDDEMNI
ncbi:unnamed protein product [Orchesella dallaii]|uniref:Cilia- and flagella-associated protein 69 ARM repeats domain-containing protein n=1 Tax=Orchesella dallaii TaxID=48710 RepID=A0ABP1S9F6_9HEXA